MKYLYTFFLLLLIACKAKSPVATPQKDDIIFLGPDDYHVTYEMKLRQPEFYQATITFMNEKGVLDSVTVREDWKHTFLAKRGTPIMLGVSVKVLNPKMTKPGYADLRILENLDPVADGGGQKFKMQTVIGANTYRDPTLLKTH